MVFIVNRCTSAFGVFDILIYVVQRAIKINKNVCLKKYLLI